MSAGLEHSAALSVISIYKAYSLALYCLTLLHVQTTQHFCALFAFFGSGFALKGRRPLLWLACGCLTFI